MGQGQPETNGPRIDEISIESKIAPEATADVAHDIVVSADIVNDTDYPITIESVRVELDPDDDAAIKPIPNHPDLPPGFRGIINAHNKEHIKATLHRNVYNRSKGGFVVTVFVRWSSRGMTDEAQESKRGSILPPNT